MKELEIKAKQYADSFYPHEFETEEFLFAKADIRVAYKQGFEDATEWHYPSRGEYPKEGENLLCLVSENFDDYRIGRLGTDRLWWTNDGVEDDIVCWQYIMPPKEKG